MSGALLAFGGSAGMRRRSQFPIPFSLRARETSSYHLVSLSMDVTSRIRRERKIVEPPVPNSNARISGLRYEFSQRITLKFIHGSRFRRGLRSGSRDHNHGAMNCADDRSRDNVSTISASILPLTVLYRRPSRPASGRATYRSFDRTSFARKRAGRGVTKSPRWDTIIESNRTRAPAFP